MKLLLKSTLAAAVTAATILGAASSASAYDGYRDYDHSYSYGDYRDHDRDNYRRSNYDRWYWYRHRHYGRYYRHDDRDNYRDYRDDYRDDRNRW